ncbi:3-methyladenine DNA glycosylase AlkD [Dysgonomonas alginatilytica]|uniref:3-methyladenine DNA glycosylase AlkD n=1 Tax=Dysgonomonas alginatilytica TaxID=1605892 RepID=A0A2V3PRP4_9BACT|nr:DNA alkylation repair protein [Dysgonomonas alginatilytica]PXV65482.1 3-methyladenine DNA glycosylase AlkD [Dysgonomonas alginatilytica]
MENILSEIRQALQDSIDEKTLKNGQNFFKEKIEFYGVKVPLVNKIGKESFATIQHKPKEYILGLCSELWKSGYLEESFIACNWSYFIHSNYETKDFDIFEGWVNNYVNNWASCDTLCNHSIGTFIEMYPQYIAKLKEWTKSDNRWVKRAAAVTLIIPARKGLFLKEIFEIADILLLDKDDLVQKGYGWMLKAASEAHQKEVFDYVLSKKAIMPRTALRYAIEKMPQQLRAEAMKK